MRKKYKNKLVDPITNQPFARNPMVENLFKVKNAKVGSTLRIRLPSDYRTNTMVTELTEKEKFIREQRKACVDFSISIHAKQDSDATDEVLIKTAKRLYRFVKKGK